MRKIIAIIVNDLRVFLADRSNLVGLLMTPTLMTVIIGLVNGGAMSGGAEPLRMDVIDNDRSGASQQLLEGLAGANPALVLCPGPNAEVQDLCELPDQGPLARELALERLGESRSIAFLEVPPGLQEALLQGNSFDVVLHTGGEIDSTQTAQQALEAGLQGLNVASKAAAIGSTVAPGGPGDSQLRARIYRRAFDSWQARPIASRLTLSGSEDSRSFSGSLQQGLGHSVPGMGSMFVMMTVLGGMAALIEERRQWTLQRLGSMPVKRRTLIGAKILARFSLGLLQFSVVFLVGAVLGMDFGKDPLALALLAAVFCLAITALSFALGSRLASPAQASGVTLLLTLTLAPLGGAWWPLQVTPRFMQLIGHVSPVAWAMDGFLALTYEGAHLADVLLPLGVLLAFTLVAFLAAIPRFQFQLD